MSFVLIGGGIDLSVGYQMSLVGVVTAMMMMVFHLPVWLAVLLGLLLGTVLGLVNGLIVTNINVFPLIVTLATSIIFQGISYLVSKANTFRSYPDEFLLLTKGQIFGIPFDVLLTILIAVVVSIIYTETVYGFRVVALGGNEEALEAGGNQHAQDQDLHLHGLRLPDRRRHHGDDLEGELDQCIVRAGDGIHLPDGCYRRRCQLHGRGGQYPGDYRGRIRPGGVGERDAAGGVGHLCPVHCQGNDPAGRGDVQ